MTLGMRHPSPYGSFGHTDVLGYVTNGLLCSSLKGPSVEEEATH